MNNRKDVMRLARIARLLTEPGEPNAEYIRGQVNLIMDATGNAGEHEVYEFLTGYISEGGEAPRPRAEEEGVWHRARADYDTLPAQVGIIHALLAVNETLESIDDALRNTVGGSPRS